MEATLLVFAFILGTFRGLDEIRRTRAGELPGYTRETGLFS